MNTPVSNKAVEILESIREATKSIFKRTEDISELLESKSVFDVKDGLSAIFENIGSGRDFSYYFPRVVKLVAHSDLEIKRSASIIISEYCAKNQDVSLLCVSTLQKGLRNQNHLIRGLSLRTLCHLHSQLFFSIQHLAISNCISDSSSYVKKIGCMGILSVFKNANQDNKYLCVELIKPFLDSTSPLVFGCAIMIFFINFTDHLTIIHKYFFKICNQLKNMEELHIPFAVELLILYSRTYFCNQKIVESTSDPDKNYSFMDKDFEFLLYCCLPLLNHRSSAVVISVSRLIYYCAPDSFAIMMVQPLIRIFSTKPFLSSIMTQNIDALLERNPNLFDNYLEVFYARISDNLETKKKKVEILIRLLNDQNCQKIFNEIKFYTTYPHFNFAAFSIGKLVDVARKRSETFHPIIDLLLSLLKSNRNLIITEAMIVLRQLLQMYSSQGVSVINIKNHISRLILMYEKLTDSRAKESVIWIVTEYSEDLGEIIFDMLRIATKTFHEESINVKHQIMILALRVYPKNNSEIKSLLFNHVFNLAKYDKNHIVRDLHRFYTNLMKFDDEKKICSSILEKMFKTLTKSQIKMGIQQPLSNLQIMTLSFSSGKEIKGYRDLPEYGKCSVDASLRAEPEETGEVTESSEQVTDEEPTPTYEEADETVEETEVEEEEDETKINNIDS